MSTATQGQAEGLREPGNRREHLRSDHRFLGARGYATVGAVELLERRDDPRTPRGRPPARQEGVAHRLNQIRKLILAAQPPRPRQDPGDRVLDARPALAPDESELVTSALSELSAVDQEIITMISRDGLTPRQIGQILGISPNVVRVRAHRARARLRSLLSTDDPEPSPGHNSVTGRPESGGGSDTDAQSRDLLLASRESVGDRVTYTRNAARPTSFRASRTATPGDSACCGPPGSRQRRSCRRCRRS